MDRQSQISDKSIGKLKTREPRAQELAIHSPLRKVDPRIKLAMSLTISLALILPLQKLVVFSILFGILLVGVRLVPAIARQIWRLKWVLIILFIGDWILVNLLLAITITLRLILLAGSFALLFSTTTQKELRLAIERLGVPFRYAFSLSIAFQSLGLMESEWYEIREAQRARGAWSPGTGRRKVIEQVRDLVSLTVPAIVLTTKRAWAMTETAHARGFESPNRQPYNQLTLRRLDWILLLGTAMLGIFFLFWR